MDEKADEIVVPHPRHPLPPVAEHEADAQAHDAHAEPCSLHPAEMRMNVSQTSASASKMVARLPIEFDTLERASPRRSATCSA